MPIWSLNEIRSEIFQKEPLAEGETVATAPQRQIFQQQEEEQQEEEQVEAETEQEEDEDDTQDKDYREGITKAVLNKFGNAIVKGLEDQVSLLENESQDLEPFLLGLLNKWNQEAENIVLRELRKGTPKAKAVGDDETPKKIPSKKRLRKLLTKVFDKDEDTYVETVEASFADIPGQSFDTTVVTILNQENAAELEALKRESGEKTRKLLRSRNLNTFSNISDTTTNRIIDRIEAGIKEGKGLRDIGADISQAEGINQSRATTIARTEALTANSLGQKAAMDSAAKVVDDLVKVWINAGDLRVRGNPSGRYPNSKDDHWDLGGEIREVDDVYSNGLDYPRDPKGKAYQTINCRCTQVIASRSDLTEDDIF
jgi:uncharacterized protein with gpF-like domain